MVRGASRISYVDEGQGLGRADRLARWIGKSAWGLAVDSGRKSTSTASSRFVALMRRGWRFGVECREVLDRWGARRLARKLARVAVAVGAAVEPQLREAPVMAEGSWVGLDVHARSTVAGVLDGRSGELRTLRVPPKSGQTAERSRAAGD